MSDPVLYDDNPVSGYTAPSATGTDAVAIGNSAVATGQRSFAVGTSRATGLDSTALNIANNSSSYGALANYSFAAGYQSYAKSGSSVALGFTARVEVSSNFSVAIGRGAQVGASSNDTLAIGAYAFTTGTSAGATAIGKDSYISWAPNAIALGNSRVSGEGGFAAQITNNSSSYGAAGTNTIAMGQNAKATGYGGKAIGFSAIASDSRATAIGAYATASGSNSLAISAGGNTCTSSGYGSIAMGVVTADASYSVAIGQKARTNGIIGSYKFSNGEIQSANDDCQTGTYLLKAGTTDATAKALTTNDSNTASTNNQIILTNYAAFSFSGTVVAREFQGDGSDYAAWEVKGTILRDANAGSTVLGQAIINDLYHTSGASAWDIALTADTTNGGLKISATGAASTNIRWVGTINTSEVRYENNG